MHSPNSQISWNDPNSAYDIALFRLEERVPAGHARARPLCLPPEEGDFVEPERAVVAGWGFQYRECQTDFWGPVRFSPCADSWSYSNKTYYQVTHEGYFDKCA